MKNVPTGTKIVQGNKKCSREQKMFKGTKKCTGAKNVHFSQNEVNKDPHILQYMYRLKYIAKIDYF